MTLVRFYRFVVCEPPLSEVDAMTEIVARILDALLLAKQAEIEGAARVPIEPGIERARSTGRPRTPVRFRLAARRRGAWRRAAGPR